MCLSVGIRSVVRRDRRISGSGSRNATPWHDEKKKRKKTAHRSKIRDLEEDNPTQQQPSALHIQKGFCPAFIWYFILLPFLDCYNLVKKRTFDYRAKPHLMQWIVCRYRRRRRRFCGLTVCTVHITKGGGGRSVKKKNKKKNKRRLGSSLLSHELDATMPPGACLQPLNQLTPLVVGS